MMRSSIRRQLVFQNMYCSSCDCVEYKHEYVADQAALDKRERERRTHSYNPGWRGSHLRAFVRSRERGVSDLFVAAFVPQATVLVSAIVVCRGSCSRVSSDKSILMLTKTTACGRGQQQTVPRGQPEKCKRRHANPSSFDSNVLVGNTSILVLYAIAVLVLTPHARPALLRHLAARLPPQSRNRLRPSS